MTTLDMLAYLLVLAYTAGFLLLSASAAQRAGRPIWLFGKGGEPQALPALLFRLAFIGAVLWPLLQAALGNPFPDDPLTAALSGQGFDRLGLALILVGAGLALWSQWHMGASWRIGAAEGEIGWIVDTGPFAISRNPVFLGQILMFSGLFLALPSVPLAAITLGQVVAIALQVPIEERVLAVTLGQPYEAYRRRVRRWL